MSSKQTVSLLDPRPQLSVQYRFGLILFEHRPVYFSLLIPVLSCGILQLRDRNRIALINWLVSYYLTAIHIMKSAGFNYFFYVWAFLIKDLEAAFFTLNIINRMDVKAYWLFTSSAFIHTRSILIYNLISNSIYDLIYFSNPFGSLYPKSFGIYAPLAYVRLQCRHCQIPVLTRLTFKYLHRGH